MARARPSRTALKIARFLLLLDADPRLRQLLPPGTAPAAEAILRGSGATRPWQIDMMRSRWAQGLYRGTEALTGRGQLVWFGLRKRWIADRLDEAIASGARQILVFGAGFDPRGALLANADPTLRVIEIDEAATADRKRAGVRKSRLDAPNLDVVSADLGEQELADVLAATPWRSDVSSAVVAEGVLMYLDTTQVERFFTGLRESVAARSTLLCTSIFTRPDGRPRVTPGWIDRPIQLTLKLAGEPLHLGLDPTAAPAFFARHGAVVTDQPTVEGLRERYLTSADLDGEPVLPYEHLIAAELADPSEVPASRSQR